MESLKKLLLLSVLATAEADFTANCPSICKCSWAAGNKQAACSNVNLHDLPKTLSTETQILDLSNNSLHEIKQRAFEDAQLINLKKLFLRDCELQTIHKHGLKGLAIMIKLDLSKNNLKELHPDTFKEITKIRWMLLNDNQLVTLDDGLFNNLPFLQKVDLNNNKIKQIGVRTFFNVPRLSNLKLDHNLLESLNIDTLSALTALTSLDIHGNPWKCDCLLQPLKKLVTSKNLCTTPVACTKPDIVQGKLWNELITPDFACPPNIVYPATGITIHTHPESDTNLTLCCQANGNPLPEVKWFLNSTLIDSSYNIQGTSKYYLSKSNEGDNKTVNLTIISPGTTDRGEYLCVATNPGGVEERSVKLAVDDVLPTLS